MLYNKESWYNATRYPNPLVDSLYDEDSIGEVSSGDKLITQDGDFLITQDGDNLITQG